MRVFQYGWGGWSFSNGGVSNSGNSPWDMLAAGTGGTAAAGRDEWDVGLIGADPLRAAYPDADGRDFQCIWQAASARNEDDTADAVRFRWLCEHPDWHFIERLCRQFVADSNMEFLAELRRVIDARRSMELGPFEEHTLPGA
mgnify:CR=1 FL=1